MYSGTSHTQRRWAVTALTLALIGASWIGWPGTLTKALSENYMAHGYCFFWNRQLVTLHVVSDMAIGLSYLAIAAMLTTLFFRERRRIPVAGIFIAFSAFILACGATHWMDVVVLWRPLYWLQGDLKLVTAVASLATVAVLRPLLPQVRAMIGTALASRKNELRFLAASNSNRDCFFILESVRNTSGDILDFRFVFVNKNGAALLSSTPQQIVGKLLCESYPVNRTDGFFEHYKNVVETGEVYRHEFPIHAENIKASWLSHQVVKLEDGVAITTTDISAFKEDEQRLTYLASHDALTGLASRSLFDERLAEALAEAWQTRKCVGLMVVDCDHFKRVNDLHGHQAGDALLVQMAARLKSSVASKDTVARVGGDEFMLVLRGLRDEQEAEALAMRVMRSLQGPLTVDDKTVHMTASIGLSVYSPDTKGSQQEQAMGPPDLQANETLRKNADAAMYQAKSDGRNRLQVFTPEMASALARCRLVECALQQAIPHNEFELVYQPRVDLRSGAVNGVEALLRWQSRHLGLIMPAEFIPIAEENGQIVLIGRWVLEQACREMHQLALTLGRPMKVAVNVSPRQFQQQTLAADVAGSLCRHRIAPEMLEIEITENLLLHESPQTRSNFDALRNLGVTLAIDDFGTGYSSMSFLTRFHVDRLKIDQSFIGRLGQDTESDAICKAIVGLAKALNIEVVAEGVDSGRQCDLLRGIGCEEAQGHWYARPVPLAELPAVLQSIEFGAMKSAAA